MNEVILLKLGEIALKGLNRRSFEDVMIKNIKRRLRDAGEFTVESRQSTIYVEPKDELDPGRGGGKKPARHTAKGGGIPARGAGGRQDL